MRRVLSPTNWPLLYHTVSNLQAEQLGGMIDRELRQRVLPYVPIDFDALYEAQIPASLPLTTAPIHHNTSLLRTSLKEITRQQYRQHARELADGKLTFHNDVIEFDDVLELTKPDSGIESYSPLWRLHLNAFTPVNWIVLGFTTLQDCPDNVLSTVQTFITSWDKNHKIGSQHYLRRAWLPHAVSLRILALCRFVAWDEAASESVTEQIKRFIYKNVTFLANHVEYDVGGNHLIENAAALLMASQFFETSGTEWQQLSRRIFERASQDQFLADGGHFERSPMYHLLALQRYLTATDLLSISTTETDPIRETAVTATRYIKALAPPDRQIPLLNDSAFDEFLSLTAALAYADAVGIPTIAEADSVGTMRDSGYYWLGNGDTRMLIDGGPVGPPHLPGHSHNDFFSFLLWINGQRIITDTGAYEYVPDSTRQYVRSVRAHNTAHLKAYEPIEIGGQYLMGRRTTPTVEYSPEGELPYFTGSYTKRSFSSPLYQHDRTIHSNGDWWSVLDSITRTDASTFYSRVHLSPEVTITRDSGKIAVTGDQARVIDIHPINASTVTELETPYFPRFGEEIERKAIEFEHEVGATHTGFVVSRSRQRHDEIKIVSGDEAPLLHVDDKQYPLRTETTI